jgi:predicted RNA-binding protein with EMAP domain
MTNYDMSIHTNPDAQAWSKFFIETTKDMDRDAFRDEEYMISWFANAMMAMHDHLTGQHVTVLDDGSAFFTATVGEK